MPNPSGEVIKGLLDKITALERRVRSIETYEFARLYGVHATSYLVNNASLTAGNLLYTSDVRGSNGVATNAKGVFIAVRALAAGVGYLLVDMDSPDVYSQRMTHIGAYSNSATMVVRLDSYGKFYLKADTANFTGIYVSVIGYWI